MIDITLEGFTSGIAGQSPEELMSVAARTCYEATKPQSGKVINLKDRIVNTGHHTVLQHVFFTFHIEGISVGDITFGLHLTNGFYNSSQRSGRFCAEMFSNPDIEAIIQYIKYFYQIDDECEIRIRKYLDVSLKVYSENMLAAEAVVAQRISIERPRANQKYIETNTPKIAQEQMRAFVPVIFPTAVSFTINLSVLIALYRSAWNPVLKDVTNKMVAEVLKKVPEISYMFPEIELEMFAIEIGEGKDLKYDPFVKAIAPEKDLNLVAPNYEDTNPYDLLHFRPQYMNNNILNYIIAVELSIAAMGQDQRHRTIRRGLPALTGNFLISPIPAMLELEAEAREVLCLWKELIPLLHPHLAVTIAPYGAMARYTKSASANAFLHEQLKRGCYCAQQEIFEISRHFSALRLPCTFKGGKCSEGARYCGRDLEEARENPFPKRTI